MDTRFRGVRRVLLVLELAINNEDILLAYEQIRGLIKRLELSKDGTIDYLVDTDKDLEYIKQCTADHKEAMQPFRDARYQIKKWMDEFSKEETQAELDKQLYVQQKVSEEQTKLRLQQQKEIQDATLQQQREEEWYMRKLNFEKQIGESQVEHAGGGNAGKHATPSTQSVRLQK